MFGPQSGLTIEQVEMALRRHGELHPQRIEQALAWVQNAKSGESWETDTDLRISDQANIYLTKE